MAPDLKELSNTLQGEAENGVQWERQWEAEKANEGRRQQIKEVNSSLWSPPHTVPQLEEKPDTLS